MEQHIGDLHAWFGASFEKIRTNDPTALDIMILMCDANPHPAVHCWISELFDLWENLRIIYTYSDASDGVSTCSVDASEDKDMFMRVIHLETLLNVSSAKRDTKPHLILIDMYDSGSSSIQFKTLKKDIPQITDGIELIYADVGGPAPSLLFIVPISNTPSDSSCIESMRAFMATDMACIMDCHDGLVLPD